VEPFLNQDAIAALRRTGSGKTRTKDELGHWLVNSDGGKRLPVIDQHGLRLRG